MGLNKLMMQRLPADVINRDRIYGIGEYCNEQYLTEFINASEKFKVLSFEKNGSNYVPYIYLEEQHAGQCDCEAGKYGLDFKIVASSSDLEARNKMTLSHSIVGPSTMTHGSTSKWEEAKTINLHGALKHFSEEELEELLKSAKFDESKYINKLLYKDLKAFLPKLFVKKNLCMFYGHAFLFESTQSFSENVEDIRQWLVKYYSDAFHMRYKRYGDAYDTFIALICEEHVLFYKYYDQKIIYFDSVPVNVSPVFKRVNMFTKDNLCYMKKLISE